MIAAVEGVLEARSPEGAVVRVGGISLLVQTPISTLSQLGPEGSTVRFYTHLHVREEMLALFGFLTHAELRAFEQLITVSGVGPKLALAVLATLSVEALQIAVGAGNIEALTGVSGIGKRTAGRIVLELRGKLGPLPSADSTLPTAASEDLIAALTSLGYNPIQIQSALRSLPPAGGLSLEDRIVLALRALAPQ
ncbi:MAG: Holliday junction branch migration protein RuvA [Chloroflexota bacterium]